MPERIGRSMMFGVESLLPGLYKSEQAPGMVAIRQALRRAHTGTLSNTRADTRTEMHHPRALPYYFPRLFFDPSPFARARARIIGERAHVKCNLPPLGGASIPRATDI